MKKIANKICKNKNLILIVSSILLVLSFIGMNLTKINYDILVYLPEDIETIKGEKILTNDFKIGAYSIALAKDMSSKDILELEERIKAVDGVSEAISLYDALGTNIPKDILPDELKDHLSKENSDLIFITFENGTSDEKTISAVKEIRNMKISKLKLSGMSSMVFDTMELSDKEIMIYIVIAVILCLLVLELSLDSYLVPVLLLLNIGCAILFNLGTNIFLGEISYITKALVAVLQLGVTTDFSIFLYHNYESKKENMPKMEAMELATCETFTSVLGSSLTTIAGFLVLCLMDLTLGKDLGIVMAKGVLLGVLSVVTLFPSLLLVFDKGIEKTRHKSLNLNFNKINNFIVKKNKIILIIFLIVLVPAYLAYKNVPVYYKIDKSLPDTLESISANNELKEKYNIVSPEMILIDQSLKADDVNEMIASLKELDGVDFVLSFSELKQYGITENMLPTKISSLFKNDEYQLILLNSLYEIASDELNSQIDEVNKIVKKYDENAIVAGEGPLMKDLVTTSDNDFNNVNTYSIISILVILIFVLKSVSLPILLIITIESAIFMNMGVSYFAGATLPFVAPIVLGTIQLGATVDYAILLTTNYLKLRNSGISKEKAMVETLNNNGKSVLVSGLCFFAATAGVGAYSKLEMVGSLCKLISRGALISCFVVITVLPAILLLFDKLILKTTYRKEKNMQKIALLLITLLLPFNINALSKDETVYATLDSNGEFKNITVNEHLINKDALLELNDFTELKDIININGNEKFEIKNNNIFFKTSGKDIFYQGTFTNELPVSVKITYKLNGEEIQAKDLIGKSGKVEINIDYSNNLKHTVLINGKNEIMYTPFVITYGTTFDSTKTSNVQVTNGKVISNGKKNIVVALAAPGLDKSLKMNDLKSLNSIKITLETTSFEVGSAYNVITSKIIDSKDLKVFDELDKLVAKTNTLQTNMNKIDSSAALLSNGSTQLKNGLKAKIDELNNTSKNDVLSDEEIKVLEGTVTSAVKSRFTDDYKNALVNKVLEEITKADNSEVKKQIEANVLPYLVTYLKNNNEYEAYVSCQMGNMTDCGVIASDQNFALLKKALEETNSKTSEIVSTKVVKDVTANVALESALETAKSISGSVAREVAYNALTETSSSLNDLYKNVSTLDAGLNELATGITKFNEEGIKNVVSLIKPTSMRFKKLIELGEEYKTVNSKSTINDSETKFIYTTASLKVPEVKKVTNEITKTTSFLDRLKNLIK